MEYDGESREREETAVEAAIHCEIDIRASVDDEGSRDASDTITRAVFVALTDMR